MTRRAARIDANHTEIVGALRAIGAHVLDLSAVGKGCPDLLVCFRGRLVFAEVKDGAKTASRRKLTPPEAHFHAEWHDAPLFVVSSVSEAYRAIGADVEGL